ncbi:putative transcriptional regulator [Jannaschia seosinensis]|uniref:Putative transcriptional regulator n=1 Tax=Jannaschia seosinensis TaxID=313367 RepID=A0A0M7BC78_9RHOB|nr:short-chain fatty acyl-CoA regulator family protein [Jannaschia seosinensis]CUH39422.1 putative transcriptional regulator [Jannaschia seosinensis]
MSEKLFAGPRVRRARVELGLTQADMARSLGISASYLNLIERNQRPLTAPVLLALATEHAIDLGTLGRGGGELQGLREAFDDPLLSAELTGPRELADMADTAPAASAGVVKLYRAYREALDRLADLSGKLAEQGAGAATIDLPPAQRFRDLFEPRPCHDPDLDDAAEALDARLPRRALREAALADWLETEHRMTLRLVPAASMPLWRVRSDRHRGQLYVSDALDPSDRMVWIAAEAMRFGAPDVMAQTLEELAGTETDEVRRLVDRHLREVAGRALAMPYTRFREAAGRVRYDLSALATTSGAGHVHAAHRLVSLRRINASGPPFFVTVRDALGRDTERRGARGFPATSFGGGCARLPVFTLSGRPGESETRLVEMPDGARFVVTCHGLDRSGPRRAVMLGLPADAATGTAYEAAAEPDPLAIGPSCRLCVRQGCEVRGEPAMTRPAGTDAWTVGASLWEFH